MSLELTVRDKTYKVDVDHNGNFFVQVDGRIIQADTLKGLGQKLTATTRASSAKVALQFKRLGRPRNLTTRYSNHLEEDSTAPWEVITVTVRGVNEHTHQLMVTWPDGTKSDDNQVGIYNRNNHIYFPAEMSDEEILSRRKLIDETEKWFKTNAIDVMSKAKAAVAEALGE
jgi:hypothetical protein